VGLRCFTKQDTELYNRGYPHLVVLVDDPPKPVPLAKLYADYFGAYQSEWPRSLARAFARALPALDYLDLKSPKAAAAAARAGEIDRDEARELVRAMLAKRRRCSHYSDEYWLYCLEALAGTDVVLEILVEELSALPWQRIGATAQESESSEDAGGHDEVPPLLAYCSGFLLLRASPAVAKATRATLEALWQRMVDADSMLFDGSVRGGLDLALHGMDAAQRVLAPSHWQYLYWWGFVSDANMIAARYADNWKAEFDPDPRLAWLGGEEILKLTCSTKLVRRVGKRRKFFFEQLAKIDHPAVAAMMEEWSEDKRGGGIAQRYLEQRGGWTIVPEKTAKPVAKKPAAAKVAAKSAKKPPAKKKPTAKKR